MKTTLDLPDALLKQVKLRAVRDGRKLKDTVADLLRAGLSAPKTQKSRPARPVITRDKKTGLPVIQGGRPAPRGQGATPERIAQILIDQEVEWAS